MRNPVRVGRSLVGPLVGLSKRGGVTLPTLLSVHLFIHAHITTNIWHNRIPHPGVVGTLPNYVLYVYSSYLRTHHHREKY